ncbi:putative methylthiotransferase [Campylobacterota bacterium]|nr:putative methylthiotransferase [Campylobacterota bacterium]
MVAKKVFFKTFGCRTNLFDTQAMIANLGDFHLAQSESDADAIVINSCSVTNHADRAARSYAHKIRRLQPEIKLIFTGCGAVSQGAPLLKQGVVNGVFSHSEKSKIALFLAAEKPFEFYGEEDFIDETILPSFHGKTRAFIKVQEGCDFACSYCVIPQTRGRARSRNPETILEQIRALADIGFGEFVLTGTNTGSYGRDRGFSLAELIAKIGAIGGVKRIRLGSIEPIQIDDKFLELLDAPFMAKHLHIALQHTSDIILELMNRRNRYKSDRELLNKIADKNFAIGTDFIVGFPRETSDVFNDAIAKIRDLPLTHIHIFKFSPRNGTIAAKMKIDVDGKTADHRRQEIAEIINEKKRNFYLKNREPLRVLLETDNSGLDQFFSRVKIVDNGSHSGWIEADRYEIGADGVIVAKSFKEIFYEI